MGATIPVSRQNPALRSYDSMGKIAILTYTTDSMGASRVETILGRVLALGPLRAGSAR